MCSMKVLDLIHHELSQLHVVHTTTDAAALKRKGDIYGELLNFTDITPQVPVEQVCLIYAIFAVTDSIWQLLSQA